MTPELWVTVVGVFISVALLTGLTASVVLTRNAPERRRLRQVAAAGVAGGNTAVLQDLRLTEVVDPRLQSIARTLPKSPKDMSRLRRRLATAGIHSFGAALVYSGAELLLPVAFGLVPFTLMSPSVLRWVVTAIVAMVGYTTPGLILEYLITKQKRRIENGLPDALDLMIVCVEAGTGLDQAIQKTSVELDVSHPDLAAELRTIVTEIRAGKSRIEAFKNFASRTKVDDVRSLVAMLVQTDRFGTSIAQALRTHAEVSRTKRRQRAEEKAAKIGVKLVFPLVFFLFPAFYVVTLGPAVIQFVRVFFGQVVPAGR
jgi:tight adherence protein C